MSDDGEEGERSWRIEGFAIPMIEHQFLGSRQQLCDEEPLYVIHWLLCFAIGASYRE